MNRRRIIAKASIFLLLGAIVNVAVAWGCAAISPCESLGQIPQFPVQLLSSLDHAWLRRIGWEPRPDTKSHTHYAGVGRQAGFGFESSGYSEVAESEHPRVEGGVFRGHSGFFAAHVRAGWPKYSLQGGITLRGSVVTARYAAACGASLRTPLSQPARLFPLQPIWPGFAINTLLYAAILWLLFAAPFMLRRWRRIKRGLCPACAYPIGTSNVCTECGKPVPVTCRRKRQASTT